MGQRSTIGIESPDGSIRYIYTQWGAPLHENGRILREHYATLERVEALLALGPLSSLGPRLAPRDGQAHHFDSPAPGVTVAYHRDRDEPWSAPTETTDRDAMRTQEWAYLFVAKDGRWEACPGDVEDAGWRPVAELLDAPLSPDDEARLADLQAKLARLTRGGGRPDRPSRRHERDDRNRIVVRLPSEHAPLLEEALVTRDIPHDRTVADGRAELVVTVPDALRSDGVRTLQMQVTLEAARVAARGVRVDVHGPKSPRQVQILGDQVVAPGTDQIDASTHRSLLRRLEAIDADTPLASREVVRDRQREASDATVDGTAEGLAIEEVRFGPDREDTQVEVSLVFDGPPRFVHVEHWVRDADGVLLGFEALDEAIRPGYRLAGRARTRVYVPGHLAFATSTLHVHDWVVAGRVVSPPHPLGEAGPVCCRDSAHEGGLSLLEWGLGRSERNGRLRLDGVVRFALDTPASVAVVVRRIANGTPVDEEQQVLPSRPAGEQAVSVRAQFRGIQPTDQLQVELQRLEPSEPQSLTVEHRT